MARKRFHLSKRVAEQHPELEKELNALVSIVDALAPLPQDEQARVALALYPKALPRFIHRSAETPFAAARKGHGNMIGSKGGIYDSPCEGLQALFGGSVLLLVIDGDLGSGFSATMQPEHVEGLVHVLRSTADQIEAGIAAQGD